MNKRISKLIILPILAISLTGCDIFGAITGKSNYAGYDEYLRLEEGMTKGNSIADLNNAMGEYTYAWSESYSEQYQNTSYTTGRKLRISKYTDYITVYTLDGESIRFANPQTIGNFEYVLSYTNRVSGATQYVGHDNSKLNKSDLPVNLQEYENGYLVVFGVQNTGIFFTKDLNFYVNENNSKTFVGPNKTTIEVSDCDLLNTTVVDIAKPRLSFPEDSKITDYYFGPHYYKEKYSSYYVYLGGIEPSEYAEVLKTNGFNVERDDEDLPFLPFYGKNGGYWIATDPGHEFKIYIKYQDYLYINNSGQSFGPTKNCVITINDSNDNYFDGRVMTKNEDWTDSEKETMAGWYDGTLNGTIPFVKMNAGYSVSRIQSYASDDLFGGALQLHSKCYKIYDESQTYFLQGYGEILEAAGYHKYQSPEPWTDAFKEWEKTEDCKYYNCYINENADIAVKFGFNAYDGNLIRVFKLSEMKSWHQNEA